MADLPVYPNEPKSSPYDQLPESPNYEGYRQTMNGLQLMRSAMPTVQQERFGNYLNKMREMAGVTQLGPESTSIDDINRSTKEAQLQSAMKEMEKRQAIAEYAPKNNRDPYPDYLWNNDPFYVDPSPPLEYGTQTVYPAKRPRVGRR